MMNSLRGTAWTHLQLVRGQLEGLLVVVYGQVGEAQLMQCSAQVVDALLAFAAQFHVAPQEGETLGRWGGVGGVFKEGGIREEAGPSSNGSEAAVAYLQDQRVASGHVLLRRHVEEGEAHAQAVQRVVGVSLEGLGVLTCSVQSRRSFHQLH